MRYREHRWAKISCILLAYLLLAPLAYAGPTGPVSADAKDTSFYSWYSAHAQTIAVTATASLLILFVVFIFVVGPEKVARKIYELLKIAVTDSSGRAVIVAVFAIIAMGVGFGLYNSQIFDKLKDAGYARGVITYLITIATIGLVFILVLQIMFVKPESEEHVKGAREVLAVLTGILGTIVGFYFGQTADQSKALRITQVEISHSIDGKESVAAFVEGGAPPYTYTLSFPDDPALPDIKGQSSSGMFIEGVAVTKPVGVEVDIMDANNNTARRIEAAPKASIDTDNQKPSSADEPSGPKSK